jgi:hypothetical protein
VPLPEDDGTKAGAADILGGGELGVHLLLIGVGFIECTLHVQSDLEGICRHGISPFGHDRALLIAGPG